MSSSLLTVPPFVGLIDRSRKARRNVLLLTGDVTGLFPAGNSFVSLEQFLIEQHTQSHIIIILDIVGLHFPKPADLSEVVRFSALRSQAQPVRAEKQGLLDQISEAVTKQAQVSPADAFIARLAETKYAPLTAMALLRDVVNYNRQARKADKEVRPICVLVRHAAALFPERELGMLDQQDRQRLVFFHTWISGQEFAAGDTLVLMVEEARSDVHNRIASLSNFDHVEIPLPTDAERLQYLTHIKPGELESCLDGLTIPQFVNQTAGLPLSQLGDLIEVATSQERKVTRSDVVKAVDSSLKGRLGSIATFKPPDHTLANVIGYEPPQAILKDVFADCDDPETAVAGILVSGANGVGKTWLMEALGFDSGRVVIELTGLRDSAFGGTEKFFEQFRMVATTFGRILINIDEAHTAFGSVHSKDAHEVERRLAGNLIKLMGNPAYFGRILWVLMTSRPDELDPDIRSRLSSVQVPLFDLEGEERKQYISQLFARKKVELTPEELETVLARTASYSNRDLSQMLTLFKARKRRNSELTVVQFLDSWQTGGSIQEQRKFQELLAAQHCTFPQLLPERLRSMKPEELAQKIQEYKDQHFM